jgi:DNA end-binding protein Ku
VARRAVWKGHLSLGELACGVALYAAASTAERVSFHVINRATGNRVRRAYVDSESGAEVAAEDQVRGYEDEGGRLVLLEPEEIAAAVPDSDKTLRVEAFVACDDVDTAYLDRPYHLWPADAAGAGAFALIREGLRRGAVAAIAHGVLFRRVRAVLIRAQGEGLVASTLNFDYELRSSAAAFAGVNDVKTTPEMLDLAKHIIETKRGVFDPAAFDDRYDAALAALVKAKAEGRKPPRRPKAAPAPARDLLEALRRSAKAAPKRKAG